MYDFLFSSTQDDIDENEKLRAQIERLQAELAERDAKKCETCKSFHANTSTCKSEWAPLACVLDGFSDWEAKP